MDRIVWISLQFCYDILVHFVLTVTGTEEQLSKGIQAGPDRQRRPAGAVRLHPQVHLQRRCSGEA